MNEAETLQTITNFLELTTSTLSIYLTLISAYLIVAYVVAEKLTTVQLSLVNSLYIVMSVMVAGSSVFYFARATDFRQELMQFRPDDLYVPTPILVAQVTVYGIVLISGMVGSVYFMIASRRRGDA